MKEILTFLLGQRACCQCCNGDDEYARICVEMLAMTPESEWPELEPDKSPPALDRTCYGWTGANAHEKLLIAVTAARSRAKERGETWPLNFKRDEEYEELVDAIRDCLPAVDVDGEGSEGNVREQVDFAGAEIGRLEREVETLKVSLAAFATGSAAVVNVTEQLNESAFMAGVASAEKRLAACSMCDGDGEISHGSCSIPDCEHAESCPACGGSGKTPTPEQVAELRGERDTLLGDKVSDSEIAAYKERCGNDHPFDLERVEQERDAALAENETLKAKIAAFEAAHRALTGSGHA